MQSPRLADRPPKEKFNLAPRMNQLVAASYLLLIIGTTLMFATDIVAKAEENGNTNVIYGWIHGFYVIPEFVASLVSSEYAIYQIGGGALYNLAYLCGIFYMLHSVRNLLKR